MVKVAFVTRELRAGVYNGASECDSRRVERQEHMHFGFLLKRRSRLHAQCALLVRPERKLLPPWALPSSIELDLL